MVDAAWLEGMRARYGESIRPRGDPKLMDAQSRALLAQFEAEDAYNERQKLKKEKLKVVDAQPFQAPSELAQQEEDDIIEKQWEQAQELQRKKLPDIGKALGCNHDFVSNIQFGVPFYYCPDCEHILDTPPAKLIPFEHLPRMGMGFIAAYVARRGMDAFFENLAQPHALQDGTGLHGAMLSDGKTPMEFLQDIEARWRGRMEVATRNNIALPTQTHMEMWNKLQKDNEVALSKAGNQLDQIKKEITELETRRAILQTQAGAPAPEHEDE